MEGTARAISLGDEMKANKAFKTMLVHLRAGGLKLDRRGINGENLDEFPMDPGEDFAIEITGEKDYRLVLGQRIDRDGETRRIKLFCRLEFIGRKRGKSWVELASCVFFLNRGEYWTAHADKESNHYTMRHPFGVFVYSVDYLAISPSSFGSNPHEERMPRLLGAAAKLFEKGKL